MLVRFLAILIVGVLGLSSASAQVKDDAVAIQLKSLGLPAISDKGYRGRTTITPYIEVIDKDAIQRFCGRWPRVLDAILIAFEESPVILKNKDEDLLARQAELGRHIEEAVGTGVFKSLHLVAGSKRRGAGTELRESRFGSNDCQPIAYLPWEKPFSKQVKDTVETAANSQVSNVQTAQATRETSDPVPVEEIAEPVRELPSKSFPGPPIVGTGPSWIVITIALVAMSGFTIVIGSYIGYQVAKIRRDRRRKERRMKKKDRRTGIERRLAEGPLPDEGERRSGSDRRAGIDRRELANDRRANRDRRDEAAAKPE